MNISDYSFRDIISSILKAIFLNTYLSSDRDLSSSLRIIYLFIYDIIYHIFIYNYLYKYIFSSTNDTKKQTLAQIDFHFLSNWMEYDSAVTVFLLIFWTKCTFIWFNIEKKTIDLIFYSELNGIPFGSENRKEYDHIPFNLQGNGNPVLRVWYSQRYIYIFLQKFNRTLRKNLS